MSPEQEAAVVRGIRRMNRAIPDWSGLFQRNHHFRAISVAVGDRHRSLGLWRIFGFIGEHSGPLAGAAVLHGPWRPTQNIALRAVYRRAVTTGRIPREDIA